MSDPKVAPSAEQQRRGPRPRTIWLLAALVVVAGAAGGGAVALIERPSQQPDPQATAGLRASVTTDGTVAGVAEAVGPSVVEIRAEGDDAEATASGIVISEQGEILTNNHVVAGASRILVTVDRRAPVPAEIVGTEPDLDMALLKIRRTDGLEPAVLGDSDRLAVGDEVVAIGSPEGLAGTVTSGIVSALHRNVTVERDSDDRNPEGRWPFEFEGGEFNGKVGPATTTYQAIQTDAALNPGNSGGALADLKGRVVGINAAMYTPKPGDAGSVGLGFAVPVNSVKAVLADLRGGSRG